MPVSLQGTLRRALAPWRDAPRAKRLRAATGQVTAWEYPSCALCGGVDVHRHLVYNGFQIVQCRKDGLIFVSPRPVDLTTFYDERYYTGHFPGLYTDYQDHARGMEREWSSRLTLLDEAVGTGRRLLDVGAATGDFLQLARQRGWSTFGIETSVWAAAKARYEKGLDVFPGELPDAQFKAGSFEAVTMWDCIEHLRDPAGMLREAARFSRRGE